MPEIKSQRLHSLSSVKLLQIEAELQNRSVSTSSAAFACLHPAATTGGNSIRCLQSLQRPLLYLSAQTHTYQFIEAAHSDSCS